MKDHCDSPIVQIDTVEGRKGGKVMLTIHFLESSLMLAYLRDSNDSNSVSKIFDNLYYTLGAQTYNELFHVILTDNGSEFSNPAAIEAGPEGNLDCRVFYCDPSSPYQKGAIENNHELIRKVLPKGMSFGNFTQDGIAVLINHINSYKRKKLNSHSPYDLFSLLHGKETLKALGISSISPKNVTLIPPLMWKA